jgi:hypothetical protein
VCFLANTGAACTDRASRPHAAARPTLIRWRAPRCTRRQPPPGLCQAARDQSRVWQPSGRLGREPTERQRMAGMGVPATRHARRTFLGTTSSWRWPERASDTLARGLHDQSDGLRTYTEQPARATRASGCSTPTRSRWTTGRLAPAAATHVASRRPCGRPRYGPDRVASRGLPGAAAPRGALPRGSATGCHQR